jgi:hypothetical protein
MCAECFASIALLLTGFVSAGGVTAAAAKIIRHKRITDRISKASGPTLSAFARANAETKENKQ